MRSVSSTDEIFLARIASAACKAVAKSSSCGTAATAAPCALFPDAKGEEFCAAAPGFAAEGWANISEVGRVDAARASGTVARKSRRFICGMVKAAHRTRNPEQKVWNEMRKGALFDDHSSPRLGERVRHPPCSSVFNLFSPPETPSSLSGTDRADRGAPSGRPLAL